MTKNIQEMQSIIKGKKICIHVGYSYVVINYTCSCLCNDNGLSLFNMAKIDGDDGKDIIAINLNNITELNKEETVYGDIQYQGQSQDGSFIVEVSA